MAGVKLCGSTAWMLCNNMAMISMLLLRNTYTCYYRDTMVCLLYRSYRKGYSTPFDALLCCCWLVWYKCRYIDHPNNTWMSDIDDWNGKNAWRKAHNPGSCRWIDGTLLLTYLVYCICSLSFGLMSISRLITAHGISHFMQQLPRVMYYQIMGHVSLIGLCTCAWSCSRLMREDYLCTL